jgi:adenine/guanine phosphoribosyltransferase-like PRPP-binding protein
LKLPYREGLVKNRYVGRTFIMPDQRMREMSVRRKLNAMPAVFEGKNVLLIDDSIVRGTTMAQIVDMVRRAGAKKVRWVTPLDDSCLWEVVGQHDLPQVSHCLSGVSEAYLEASDSA